MLMVRVGAGGLPRDNKVIADHGGGHRGHGNFVESGELRIRDTLKQSLKLTSAAGVMTELSKDIRRKLASRSTRVGLCVVKRLGKVFISKGVGRVHGGVFVIVG